MGWGSWKDERSEGFGKSLECLEDSRMLGKV